jgi:glycosyltransferase involved in cell wall biosynthesis
MSILAPLRPKRVVRSALMLPSSDAAEVKRVALILPDLGGGGAERVAITLAQDFTDAGHEVDLVLLGSGGALKPFVPSSARVIELGTFRFRNALVPLVRYFRDRKPDSTQAFMWPVTALAVLAHRLGGSSGRLILSEHNVLSHQYGRNRCTMTALRLTTRLLYPLADARVCVSEGSARDLAKISSLSRDSFSVIYNPVVPAKASATAAAEAKKQWPKGGRRLLSVGRLNDQKNHELLIRAFALVADRTPASLMILGEGALRTHLEHLIRDLGLVDRVVLPGYVANPWPYYASAELLVMSSDYEGYPLVLIEALFSGLNIVSTDCQSGPREILDNGRYGELVPLRDAQRLADAIEDSLSRPLPPELLVQRASRLTEGSLEAYQAIMLRQSDLSVLGQPFQN